MAITVRDLATVLHGMGFGALFMMAFSGAIGIIYAVGVGGAGSLAVGWHRAMFRIYLVSMAVLAWLTTLSGTYLIYPWYRAVPPSGTTDLAGYPRSLLLSDPSTAGWHELGMEWKEHIAWLPPIVMTMVAYVFFRYGPEVWRQRHMRNAILAFTVAAFLATGVAATFGALLNKNAPVRGGLAIHLMRAG